jgi:hypothetical protein
MSKAYAVNTEVAWQWGQSTAEARIREAFTERVTCTIKGSEIVRNASADNPAYRIEQDDGDEALKSHSELRKAG